MCREQDETQKIIWSLLALGYVKSNADICWRLLRPSVLQGSGYLIGLPWSVWTTIITTNLCRSEQITSHKHTTLGVMPVYGESMQAKYHSTLTESASESYLISYQRPHLRIAPEIGSTIRSATTIFTCPFAESQTLPCIPAANAKGAVTRRACVLVFEYEGVEVGLFGDCTPTRFCSPRLISDDILLLFLTDLATLFALFVVTHLPFPLGLVVDLGCIISQFTNAWLVVESGRAGARECMVFDG